MQVSAMRGAALSTVVGPRSYREAPKAMENLSSLSRKSMTKAMTTMVGDRVPETPYGHVQRDASFRTLASSTIYLAWLSSFLWRSSSHIRAMIATRTPWSLCWTGEMSRCERPATSWWMHGGGCEIVDPLVDGTVIRGSESTVCVGN